MGNKKERKIEEELVSPEAKSSDKDNPFAGLKELGPYSIEGELGHGGMGYVFRARDTRDGKIVAVKVMSPGFSMDESMVRRFKREAALLQGLHHRGIVTIFDVNMEGEPKYYVMEFIPGRTLSDELKEGPLPADDVLGIAWQVAEALGAAHEAGIIHRDIKPSNIMKDETGTIKLTDFGIARVIGTGGGTKAGRFLGTPAYMSPEQVLGKQLGTASDIYSFGVVLYEMLTGKAPFESANPLVVMGNHVYEDPPPPKELNPDVPAILSELVMRMLKKKREKRISNPKVFESRLQDCIRVMGGDLVTVTSGMRLDEESKRESRSRLVKFVLFFCAVGTAVLLLLKSGGGVRTLTKRYLMPPTDHAAVRESVSRMKKPFLRARAALGLLGKGDLESLGELEAAFESCTVSEKKKLLSIIGRRRIPLTISLLRRVQSEEELKSEADAAIVNFGDGFLSSLIQSEVKWTDKLDAAGKLGGQWASSFVEAALKTEDVVVHLQAISVIEEMGGDAGSYVEGVVISARRVLGQGDGDEIRRLSRQLTRVKCPEMRPLQRDIASGRYRGVGKSEKLLMAKTLALMGDGSGASVLRANLGNPDPYEAVPAYRGMVALRGNRALRAMKRKLNSAEPLMRVLSASELFAMGDKRAETVLRKCLEDPDWRVRQAAVAGLAEGGREGVLELLREDLECKERMDDSRERICGALDVLGEYGGSSMLSEFCLSCDAEFVTVCTKALSKSAQDDSVKTLASVAVSKDDRISEEAKFWARAGLLRLISEWTESENTK